MSHHLLLIVVMTILSSHLLVHSTVLESLDCFVWKELNDQLQCFVRSDPKITARDDSIKNFTESLDSKSHGEITELVLIGKTFLYIPKHLGMIFHEKLTNLTIARCGLKELTTEVLKSFPELTQLHLDANEIDEIGTGLFRHNRKLILISLTYNRIKKVAYQVFDGLKFLEGLYMDENKCVSAHHERRKGMEVFLDETIAKYCTHAEERLSDKCGKALLGGGNIYGGDDAEAHKYPWIAVLIHKKTGYFCGGTLITLKKVITAAHCIEPKENAIESATADPTKPKQKKKSTKKKPTHFKVRLGVHNISTTDEEGVQNIVPSTIKIHPNWNSPAVKSTSKDADIAIIIMAAEAKFDRFVQPLCFPLPSIHDSVGTSSKGLVVGYGKSENEKYHEKTPKMLSVIITDLTSCYEQSKQLKEISSPNMLCGDGGLDKDGKARGVCTGDSGSGLNVEIKESDRQFLRGVVSTALYDKNTGCDIRSNQLYVDIMKYNSWVIDINEYDA